MKRLNHTLLFATVVMVSISGCSGGKLRNLLSRNDYQSLQDRDTEQSGFPDDGKTHVVSAETEENKNFFRLPGFLKGEEESTAIAPDPFITAAEPTATEDKVAAYRAKVDERIARQALAAKTTLSDVEKQAKELYENTKDSIDNPFKAFNENKAAEQNSVASTDSKPDFPEVDQAGSFAEMFGQQTEAEVASPLIADASSDQFGTTSPPQSEMSEFDKLLQAHQQLTPSSSGEEVIAPPEPKSENMFAELEKTVTAQPDASDFFGNEIANNDSISTSESDNSFDNLMNGNQDSEPAADIWRQLDCKTEVANASQPEDTFAAEFSNLQQPTETDHPFGEDFQQTASRHGFSNNKSTWGSLSTELDQDQSLTLLAPPAEQEQDNSLLMTHVDTNAHGLNTASEPDSFFPASQSQSVGSTSSPLEGQGMGLIIPASDSSDSGGFFDFSDQPSGVQQISATQSNAELTAVTATSLEGGMNLFEEAEIGPAIQTVEVSGGWTRRTWFLILGCVLIAGLLFLPERQKR